MILTREQLLAKKDLPREEVFVPEWGASVVVRTLTVRERTALEMKLSDKRGKRVEDVQARIAVACVCDPVLSDADIPELLELSTAGMQRIFEVAGRLNRFLKEDVEELAKN